MRKIAFFDFDGTITTRDTLFEMIKYQKGSVRLYAWVLANLPMLAAYKLNLISGQRAKEKLLTWFFKGTELPVFQNDCNLFTIERLPLLIKNQAQVEIKKLQELGFEIVVVSASAENWIKNWSDGIGAQLLATKLEAVNGKLTGKIDGKNCNGLEKAIRIKSAYNLSEYDWIFAYGDSKGDTAMLALATRAHYKPFRN